MRYDENMLLRVGKRWQNSKRGYLLINPLQAKHIPVSPRKARSMMVALGEKLAAENPADAVIGFAETATAIGAAVAEAQGNDCFYITTTREKLPNGAEVISFLEEHSHAVDQQLDVTSFPFSSVHHIAVVDDEISTGKTLLNMVSELKARSLLEDDTMVTAVSVLNRLNEEQKKTFSDRGLSAVCLLHLPQSSYEEEMAKVSVSSTGNVEITDYSNPVFLETSTRLPNPRLGVSIGTYRDTCIQLAAETVELLRAMGFRHSLVLGTEECMYPALIVGEHLEKELAWEVCCHATTRSPIGISTEENYPIKTGFTLPSFYDLARRTYIYNLSCYDTAVIITDAEYPNPIACSTLSSLLNQHGVNEIFFVKG